MLFTSSESCGTDGPAEPCLIGQTKPVCVRGLCIPPCNYPNVNLTLASLDRDKEHQQNPNVVLLDGSGGANDISPD